MPSGLMSRTEAALSAITLIAVCTRGLPRADDRAAAITTPVTALPTIVATRSSHRSSRVCRRTRPWERRASTAITTSVPATLATPSAMATNTGRPAHRALTATAKGIAARKSGRHARGLRARNATAIPEVGHQAASVEPCGW